MKKRKKPMNEKARSKMISQWENTTSVNPDFKGATPREIAKALLKPVKGKPVKGKKE